MYINLPFVLLSCFILYGVRSTAFGEWGNDLDMMTIGLEQKSAACSYKTRAIYANLKGPLESWKFSIIFPAKISILDRDSIIS